MPRVYHYWVYDPAVGDMMLAGDRRTAESVDRMPGAMIYPQSGEVVDEACIDEDGRYVPPPE